MLMRRAARGFAAGNARKGPADAVREHAAQRQAARGGGGRGRGGGGNQRGGGGGGRGGGRGPRTSGLEAPSGSVVWDATVTDPRPLNFGYVPDALKDALYAKHQAAPETWTVAKLAESERLPENRVKAIIMLKDVEAAERASGAPLIGEGIQEDFEKRADAFLQELAQKYKVPLRNAGHREDAFVKADPLETRTRFEVLDEDADAGAIAARAAKALAAAKKKAEADGAAAVAAAVAAAEAPRSVDAARPGALAIVDLDAPGAPTATVVQPGEYASRVADDREVSNRSWTRKAPYWDIHFGRKKRGEPIMVAAPKVEAEPAAEAEAGAEPAAEAAAEGETKADP